jgi:sulfide:quinone oxidoreductase
MSGNTQTHVLIAGGGVAALEAALALRTDAEDRVDVELLAPETRFWYRPLAVAEPFGLAEARHFELTALVSAAGAHLTVGALQAVDVPRKRARTYAGQVIPYDALLIACGLVPTPAVPGALTFRGPADTEGIQRLLSELDEGEASRVAVVVPSGAVWTLAAYELALLTAGWAAARDLDVRVQIVTPEDKPLAVFGPEASSAVAGRLDDLGIDLRLGVHPVEFRHGCLSVIPGEPTRADRVIALPRLRGRHIDGVAQTVEGFIPVDAYGRVAGAPAVYAAGDATTFPVKQGGIAAQQAEAAASSIAADAGAGCEARPFRPVLRGLLLTGREPVYLRRDLTRMPAVATVAPEPLWWPPAKIVGRHLAPFLGALAGDEAVRELEAGPNAVPVHRELDIPTTAPFDALLRAAEHVGDDEDTHATAADAMEIDLLIVGCDETLSSAAASMREKDVDAALVVDGDALVGILTARDLLRAVAGRANLDEALVRHFMTSEPLSVSPHTRASAAVFLMAEYGVHHLPVVDEGRPVGLLALGDATRAARSRIGIGLGF